MECFRRSDDGIDQVNVPDAKHTQSAENQHRQGTDRRNGIGCQHDLLFAVAVYESTCNESHKNIWHVVAESHERYRQSTPMLLVSPQNQGEGRQGTSQLGHRLAQPKYDIFLKVRFH